jgi:hypothetical protein
LQELVFFILHWFFFPFGAVGAKAKNAHIFCKIEG